MLVNAVKATEADAGHHYCFLLSPQGWRNQGMVPDNNRAPFIAEYIARPGITRIAFSRFCSVENPHHTHVFSEVL